MVQSRFDLIFHPVRLRIMHIVERARQISLNELQHRLPDVPQDALAHHLDLLVEGGVIVTTGQTEALYSLVKAHANITQTELRLATPGDHLRYFTTFVAGMIDTYARYLKQPDADLVADGIELRQELLYLSDEELRGLVREFQARLDELAENRPDGQRIPRIFSWIVMPEVSPGTGASPGGPE